MSIYHKGIKQKKIRNKAKNGKITLVLTGKLKSKREKQTEFTSKPIFIEKTMLVSARSTVHKTNTISALTEICSC